jgi:Tol biopolymer transport system component
VQGIATRPAFSPDGKEIVFASAVGPRAPFHLFVYSSATHAVSQITNESSASDHDPSYSSDGSTIVFARAYLQRLSSTGGHMWNDWEIVTIRRDGSDSRVRTSLKYYELTSPRFAANDTQVVYSATDTGHTAMPSLWWASLQSPQPPRSFSPSVTKHACGSRGSDPQFSRDRHALTFIADGQECFAYDVYVMDRDTADVRALRVTLLTKYNRNPIFLPRTAQIFYLAATQEAGGGRGRYSLYSVGSDGSGPHELAGPELFDDPLHWRSK